MMQPCFEETDEEMGLPVLETELGNQELEQAVVIRQEEFAEVETGNEKLKDKKVD